MRGRVRKEMEATTLHHYMLHHCNQDKTWDRQTIPRFRKTGVVLLKRCKPYISADFFFFLTLTNQVTRGNKRQVAVNVKSSRPQASSYFVTYHRKFALFGILVYNLHHCEKHQVM